MVRIQIEVFSDTLCPWCYIGKKYLDNAMDLFRGQHPDAVFDVVWRPFYLYPNLEKTGKSTSPFHTSNCIANTSTRPAQVQASGANQARTPRSDRPSRRSGWYQLPPQRRHDRQFVCLSCPTPSRLSLHRGEHPLSLITDTATGRRFLLSAPRCDTFDIRPSPQSLSFTPVTPPR